VGNFERIFDFMLYSFRDAGFHSASEQFHYAKGGIAL
jgi:hypothetical protein